MTINSAKPYRNHSEIDYIQIEYWSSDRYASYEEADEAGAVRTGDYHGYTAACDAIDAACSVADILQHNAHKDDIRVRIKAGNIGDLRHECPECFLSRAIFAINDLF